MKYLIFLDAAVAGQIETSGDSVSNTLKQYELFVEGFVNFRKNTDNKGMTSHAGDERYIKRGPEAQAVEDITDLVAYYIVDPEYLQRYLQFLSDPQFAEQKEKLKLMTIHPQLASMIYKNISLVIEGLLPKTIPR